MKRFVFNRISLMASCLLYVVCLNAQSLTDVEIFQTLQIAVERMNVGKDEEAIGFFEYLSDKIEPQKSPERRDMYLLCQSYTCRCYEKTMRFEDGYRLARKMLDSELTEEEKKNFYTTYVRNGYCYAFEKEPTEALEIFQGLLPYATPTHKKSIKSAMADIWYKEGNNCNIRLDYDNALYCYKNALECLNEGGDNARQKIDVIEKIAYIHYLNGNIRAAFENYEYAYGLAIGCNDSYNQMLMSSELYKLSHETNDFEQMAKYSAITDSLYEQTADSQVRVVYYTLRGNVAARQMQFEMAERWYHKALAEGNGSDVINVHLRDMYLNWGEYDKALEYAYLLLKKTKGNGDSTWWNYNSLALIHRDRGDRDNCFNALDSMLMEEPYIEDPKERHILYLTRAMCHNHFGNHEAALADYRMADKILASEYPDSDTDRVSIYPHIGGAEHKLGNYNESERYYRLYAEHTRAIYGINSIQYTLALVYMANAQAFNGDLNGGCANYDKAISKLRELTKSTLISTNTAEKESFWRHVSDIYTRMTPYALEAGLYNTEYTRISYDASLLSKAFLLDSERSMHDVIECHGDDTDMEMYQDISEMNGKINIWKKHYSQNIDSIILTSEKVRKLESRLMKRCKATDDMVSFVDIDYDIVKKALEMNDVLIDFADFTHKAHGREYAVYIIDRKHKYPLLQRLFYEFEIDSLNIIRPDMYYSKEYAPEIVRLLWEPLGKHVAEGATIYYVPSQLLFQISLESLPLEDGTLLGEHYNFVRLSSARELVGKYNASIGIDGKPSAVLYGGLQYTVSPELMAENAKEYRIDNKSMFQNTSAKGDSAFKELENSISEVDSISRILEKSGFDVKPYTGVYGTEESFLDMHGKSPMILHVATHGFYYTPEEAMGIKYLKGYRDAMMLSGLIMSGGNAAWQGADMGNGTLGGVLTANDISKLDLSATELVVLSACKSGRGNVTPEGLYGLQRAFKKAGAGTLVMSLWNIKDEETAEFMNEFYKSLVNNNWNKHSAFEEARTIMRMRYPDKPYIWASFVMLD